MTDSEIKDFLEERLHHYNNRSFISNDPISIPHQFSTLQDIEISGFLIAIISWGNRAAIIKSGMRLMEIMDHAPHDFILNHSASELQNLERFYYRTFQPVDALYFVHFLKEFYQKHSSLELAFNHGSTMKERLISFEQLFFESPTAPKRTKKHIATPSRNSSCKRLNMFLRWMVRKDPNGVDFGIWSHIKPSELICPLDVHVGRVARELGILVRKQDDWKAAEELTAKLRTFDPTDPVKYDFALFGTGIDLKKA